MGKARQHGFTLIEFSIVLVIIGLIVGGVLVGRDLIKAAEMRAQMSQLQSFTTATMTFQGKYDCLPGDCPDALSFFPGPKTSCTYNNPKQPTSTCNGDGDGRIDSSLSNPLKSTGETYLFWQQLAFAGLIPGSYNGETVWGINASQLAFNVPSSKISSAAGIEIAYIPPVTDPSNGWYYVSDYGNVFFLGTYSGSGLYMTHAVTPAVALAIDSKMDDGKPGRGVVLTNVSSSYYATGCASSDDASTAVYVLATTTEACPLIFRAGF